MQKAPRQVLWSPTPSPTAGEKGGTPLDLVAGLASVAMTCSVYLFTCGSPTRWTARRTSAALSRHASGWTTTLAHSLAYSWKACLWRSAHGWWRANHALLLLILGFCDWVGNHGSLNCFRLVVESRSSHPSKRGLSGIFPAHSP